MSQKENSNQSKQKKEPETIKVDKDFLMMVLNKVEGIGKEVGEMKQGTFKTETPVKELSSEQDHIFQVMETIFIDKIPPMPQDIIEYKQRSDEFRKKLEALMKEYKVVQTTAMFLKKL